MIRTIKLSVTATGSAGSATGTATSARAYSGAVKAMYVDWHASAPATSDIDIVADSGDSQPQVTLYDKDDANTDLWVYPKVQSTDTAGAAIANEYQHPLINSTITVTVAQCDALTDAVVVYIFIDEDA